MNVVIIDKLRQRSKLAMSKGQCQNEGHSTKSRASEKQLLLVTFAFLILTIPMKLFAFYVLGVGPQNMPSYFAGCYLFYQISEKTIYTNHGINFFLFVISGQNFRTDLKTFLTCGKTQRNKKLTLKLSDETIEVGVVSSCGK